MRRFKDHIDEAILTGADNKHLEKKLDKVRNRTQQAMSQKPKSTMEEVEQVEEAYRKPTEAEIKKDKERERKASGKKRPSMDHKSVSKKMYGNMMGGLKEEEQIDEILDTPKAMTSYKNKAKASYDKAASSAAAKILRGKDKDGNRANHRPELKTMDKRKKGMAAADMVAVKRTFDNLRKEDITEADIAEILHQYALSENVNADQLAELTEEEINEIIGKAIGGAFKLGAKAAVGAGRMAGKAAKRTVMNKQGSVRFTKAAREDRKGNRAEKAAKKAEKERARRDRIANARKRIEKARDDLDQAKAKPKTA